MQNDASYHAKIGLIQNVKNLIYSYLHCFEKRFSKHHILHHLRVNDYGDIKINQLELLADLIGNANEFQNWVCYDEVLDNSGPNGPNEPPRQSSNNNPTEPVKGCMDRNAINYNILKQNNDVCIYSPVPPASPNLPPPGSPDFSIKSCTSSYNVPPQNTTTKIITMFYDMYDEGNDYKKNSKNYKNKKEI